MSLSLFLFLTPLGMRLSLSFSETQIPSATQPPNPETPFLPSVTELGAPVLMPPAQPLSHLPGAAGAGKAGGGAVHWEDSLEPPWDSRYGR